MTTAKLILLSRNRLHDHLLQCLLRLGTWVIVLKPEQLEIYTTPIFRNSLWLLAANADVFPAGACLRRRKYVCVRRLLCRQPGKVYKWTKCRAVRNFHRISTERFFQTTWWYLMFFRNVERFQKLCSFARWRNIRVWVYYMYKIARFFIRLLPSEQFGVDQPPLA